MQPLVSPVDHEARNNSYNREADSPEPQREERTPLLGRIQAPTQRQSTLTAIAVASMLLLLVAGVIIGTYLLIEQERYTPDPVEEAVRIVPRESWDTGGGGLLSAGPTPARHLVVVHTNTRECDYVADCRQLLRRIQSDEGELPYNFLVSTDGRTYEGLGWKESPLPTRLENSALVLAFIGNFTDKYPDVRQLREARGLCGMALSQHRLSPSYTIVGRDLQLRPTKLFEALSSLREWDRQYSDPQQ